jgi:hypothetical protein
MSGSGTLWLPDGRHYEGHFEEDKRSGIGKFTWPDGRTYVGSWKLGRQHGCGTYTDARGRSWTGVWNHGQKVRPPGRSNMSDAGSIAGSIAGSVNGSIAGSTWSHKESSWNFSTGSRGVSDRSDLRGLTSLTSRDTTLPPSRDPPFSREGDREMYQFTISPGSELIAGGPYRSRSKERRSSSSRARSAASSSRENTSYVV